MSVPRLISWLPIDTTLIAPLQDLAAAGNLVLNSKVLGQPQGPFIYDKVIRSVSLTSANDLHLVNFTITGIGSPVDANGNPTQVLGLVSDVIAGPNANSVSTPKIYSQIISISSDSAALGVSAGSGPAGITDYVFLDYNRTMFQSSVQLQFNPRTTATVTVYESLTKPQIIDINKGNLVNIEPIPAFELLAPITNVTTNQIGILRSPVSIAWANIKTATTDLINFTVLQQGTSS